MKLFQKQLVTGLIIMTGATCAQAATATPAPVYVPLVFAQTYVSAGAAATFGGDIVATTYFVGGAGTSVTGSIQSGTAITLGAGSSVMTNVAGALLTESGTATTFGAGLKEFGFNGNNGEAYHGTALTRGAGHINNNLYAEGQTVGIVMKYFQIFVETDRTTNTNLNPVSTVQPNELESAMSLNTLLPRSSGSINDTPRVGSPGDPITYVYNADSLTTGAGVILTLECGNNYVFNIEDMLSLGARTKIEMDGTCTNTVTWNMGGYASVGENAEMIGNVLAKGYISTGAESVMKGNLHSETSYVTLGEGSTVIPQHQPGS
jgi:hypothetical protein